MTTHLYCDACGRVHEDTNDFIMCECGRIGVRMGWADEVQIMAHERHREEIGAWSNKWIVAVEMAAKAQAELSEIRSNLKNQ